MGRHRPAGREYGRLIPPDFREVVPHHVVVIVIVVVVVFVVLEYLERSTEIVVAPDIDEIRTDIIIVILVLGDDILIFGGRSCTDIIIILLPRSSIAVCYATLRATLLVVTNKKHKHKEKITSLRTQVFKRNLS